MLDSPSEVSEPPLNLLVLLGEPGFVECEILDVRVLAVFLSERYLFLILGGGRMMRRLVPRGGG